MSRMHVSDLPEKIDFYRIVKKKGGSNLTVKLDVVPDESVSSLFWPNLDGFLYQDIEEDVVYISCGNAYVLWFRPGAHSREEAIGRLVDAAVQRTEELIKAEEEKLAIQRASIEDLMMLKAESANS